MISENIKNNINIFLGVTSAPLRSTNIPLLGTENNQFSIYMTNHIFNGEITEIPIYNSLSSRGIIPLFTSSTSINERKTFGPLLKELSLIREAGELNKIRDKDGNLYYGMRGLILNSNLEPLVLSTIRPPRRTSATTELILRVSPKVFNSDNVVCKGIQKYFIEYCSTVSRYFSIISGFTTMTVIINNDIDKFIRHVKAPTNINVNEEIQQLLVDNIDKLCL
ncbi:MAG: hypothetical protein [Bacteriophage sp.]|nr:MAG: hypothetical protein [Bacteriophage sp.]